MRIVFQKKFVGTDVVYVSGNNDTVRRENDNGDPSPYGNWVFRSADGVKIDEDTYRNALFNRHNIEIVYGNT